MNQSDELALIIRSQEGDGEATERLLAAHEGLLRSIVTRYPENGAVDRDDLFQEATIGLLETILEFDIDSGLRLSTYGKVRAQAAVARAVAASAPIPVAERTLRRYLKAWQNAEDYDEAQMIAVENGMGFDTFRQVYDALNGVTSLDSTLDEEGYSLHETVPCSASSGFVEGPDLSVLDSEQRYVIRLAYGYETGKPMTDEEISAYLHSEFEVSMSRATVQRRRQSALDVLREKAS